MPIFSLKLLKLRLKREITSATDFLTLTVDWVCMGGAYQGMEIGD